MHAALRVGDSMLMLNEEMPEYGGLSPLSLNGTGVTIHIYTDNVDEAFNRAVSAGAQVKMPLMDQFWAIGTAWFRIPLGTNGRLRRMLRTCRRKKCNVHRMKLWPKCRHHRLLKRRLNRRAKF
jgi:PhnB protein